MNKNMFTRSELGIIASVMEAEYARIYQMYSRCPREFLGTPVQENLRGIVRKALELQREMDAGTLITSTWETGYPPRPGQYLAMVPLAREPACLYYYKGQWWDEDNTPYRVTAWAEMPEAYKEEVDDAD